MARRRGHPLLDLILVFLTGGLWLLWMVVRYLRANT
jgi:hypothetical protein